MFCFDPEAHLEPPKTTNIYIYMYIYRYIISDTNTHMHTSIYDFVDLGSGRGVHEVQGPESSKSVAVVKAISPLKSGTGGVRFLGPRAEALSPVVFAIWTLVRKGEVGCEEDLCKAGANVGSWKNASFSLSLSQECFQGQSLFSVAGGVMTH